MYMCMCRVYHRTCYHVTMDLATFTCLSRFVEKEPCIPFKFKKINNYHNRYYEDLRHNDYVEQGVK